jgi:hypothetical protein
MRKGPRFEQESRPALERMVRLGGCSRCPHAARCIVQSPLTCECLLQCSEREASCECPPTIDRFHGTASGLLASILEKGLVPGGAAGSDCWAVKHRRYAIVDASAEKRPRSIYVVKQPTLSHCYALHAAEMNPGSTAVILHLKLPAAVLATMTADELDDDAQRFEGVIKAEWIAAISRLTDT